MQENSVPAFWGSFWEVRTSLFNSNNHHWKSRTFNELEIKALLEGLEGDLQQGILEENLPHVTLSGFSLSEDRKQWDFCETGGTSPLISHCFEGKIFQPRGEMGWGEGNIQHFHLKSVICVASWVWRLKAEKLEFLNLYSLCFSRGFFLENGDALNCLQARAQKLPGCRVCRVNIEEINFYLHDEIYFILCFKGQLLWSTGMHLTQKREGAMFYWAKRIIW